MLFKLLQRNESHGRVRFIPVVDIYWKPNVCTRLSKLNDKQYLSCGSSWEMFDYKHFTIDGFFALQKDRFFYFERNKSSERPFQLVHQPNHLRFQEAILALFNKSEADVFILFSGMPAGLEERVFMIGRSLFYLDLRARNYIWKKALQVIMKGGFGSWLSTTRLLTAGAKLIYCLFRTRSEPANAWIDTLSYGFRGGIPFVSLSVRIDDLGHSNWAKYFFSGGLLLW